MTPIPSRSFRVNVAVLQPTKARTNIITKLNAKAKNTERARIRTMTEDIGGVPEAYPDSPISQGKAPDGDRPLTPAECP
jgi:hypothetical protein